MVLSSVQGIAFKSGGDMHEPYIEVLLLTCYFMIVWCTLCLKKCSLFIFRITLQKKRTDFNNFGVQNHEKISHKNIVNLPHLNNVARLPCDAKAAVFAVYNSYCN